MATRPSSPAPAPGPLRGVLVGLGILCVGLGALGIFLPLLPTTPFLLLAAACFLRSSPTLHGRLLGNRVFGPTLWRWQRERTIPRPAKRGAVVLVVATFALSIAAADEAWHRGVLAGLMLGLLAFLVRLPTGSDGDARGGPPDS